MSLDPRYTYDPVAKQMSAATMYFNIINIWRHVAGFHEQDGTIQPGTAEKLAAWLDGKTPDDIDVPEIERIEKQETGHDILALQKWLRAQINDPSLAIHYGLTSYNVLDPARMMQMRKSADQVIDLVASLCNTLQALALEHKHTRCVARTHGQHAEPTTFGLELLGHRQEFLRGIQRLKIARYGVSTMSLAGAVGNYGETTPELEAKVAKVLDLRVEEVATQILPRDRHADMVYALATVAQACKRLATNLRLRHTSEVKEVREYYPPGRKGSSAMPHKQNPSKLENLCGLADIIVALVRPALDNIVTWHERDIAHSSVERIMLPQAFNYTAFILIRLQDLLQSLRVYPARMQKWLEASPIQAQPLKLALRSKGMDPAQADDLAQKLAYRCDEEDLPFRQVIEDSPEAMTLLTAEDLDAIFDLDRRLRHIPVIYERVGLG